MTERYTEDQLRALASACRDELERARTMLLFALLHNTSRGDTLAHFMVAEASVRSVLSHITEARDREWPSRAFVHTAPDLAGDRAAPHPCVGAPACDVCEAREQDAYVVSALLARAMGAGL